MRTNRSEIQIFLKFSGETDEMSVGLKARRARELRMETSVELVSPETLDSRPVRLAVHYWQNLRRLQRFPARDMIVPRDMAPFLRNIVLIRVIDGGRDYEYRIVGDACVQAFGSNFQGARLTEVEAVNPAYGLATRAAYEHVRTTGAPFALRGWISPSTPSLFSYHETALLPLGKQDAVDYILAASSYTPRAIDPEEACDAGDLLPESWKTVNQI
ncbi:MAG TPA: PAS domain-containing protein [Rhizomicrobium sp.]